MSSQKIYTIYATIFKKLNRLINFDLLKEKGNLKYIAPGFMDLNIDFLYEENNSFVISLAHNYVQNGDLMKDPDMEVRINIESEIAEALLFQQSYPYLYYEVYSKINGQIYVNMKNKRENNHFLNKWLTNIKRQGYKLNN